MRDVPKERPASAAQFVELRATKSRTVSGYVTCIYLPQSVTTSYNEHTYPNQSVAQRFNTPCTHGVTEVLCEFLAQAKAERTTSTYRGLGIVQEIQGM